MLIEAGVFCSLPIYLTKTFSKHYNAQYSPQFDITGNPDIVQTNTLLAVVSGLHYFNYRVMNPFGKYKPGVDLSNTAIKTIGAVTLRVNGGYIQKKERRKAVEKAIEALH